MAKVLSPLSSTAVVKQYKRVLLWLTSAKSNFIIFIITSFNMHSRKRKFNFIFHRRSHLRIFHKKLFNSTPVNFEAWIQRMNFFRILSFFKFIVYYVTKKGSIIGAVLWNFSKHQLHCRAIYVSDLKVLVVCNTPFPL